MRGRIFLVYHRGNFGCVRKRRMRIRKEKDGKKGEAEMKGKGMEGGGEGGKGEGREGGRGKGGREGAKPNFYTWVQSPLKNRDCTLSRTTCASS